MEPIRLSIQSSQDTVVLNWSPPYGVLQSAPEPNGGWTNVPGSSPVLLPAEGNACFRVVDHVLPLETGADLYQSAGTIQLSLPSGFFGPGSEPFEGAVALQGAPLGSAGSFELGTTDTVIERLTDATLHTPPSTSEIPIEMVQLSLRSAVPITVIVDGVPREYQVSVYLPAVAPTMPTQKGTLQMQRLSANSGTFALDVRIIPGVELISEAAEKAGVVLD